MKNKYKDKKWMKMIIQQLTKKFMIYIKLTIHYMDELYERKKNDNSIKYN